MNSSSYYHTHVTNLRQHVINGEAGEGETTKIIHCISIIKSGTQGISHFPCFMGLSVFLQISFQRNGLKWHPTLI